MNSSVFRDNPFLMIDDAPFDWLRAPRGDFDLSPLKGVYALFLVEGSHLPEVALPERGLIYVGKAGGAGGLAQRCHFMGATRNHSPRKSLAVLLMDELHLRPIRIDKPNGAYTWGLDRPSEARLTSWMFANLLLTIEPRNDPDARETEIITCLAPPLNLASCVQTEQHRRISVARKRVRLALGSDRASIHGVASARVKPPSRAALDQRVGLGNLIESADEMAARYGLNAKTFRSALRRKIPWYLKPQVWEFPVGSHQHRDMEAVASCLRG